MEVPQGGVEDEDFLSFSPGDQMCVQLWETLHALAHRPAGLVSRPSDPPSTSSSSTLVPHYRRCFSLSADTLSGCLLILRTLSWLSELTSAPDVLHALLKTCAIL